MQNLTRRENFNYKLKWLLYFWQDYFGKTSELLPSHRAFFDMCSIIFNKSHKEHIELFEDYMLTGIDNGYFPDNYSKKCREFFYPIIELWHEITETPKTKLPLCEDIFILSEALSRCSDETNRRLFKAYGLSGDDFSVTAPQRTWVRHIPMHLQTKEKHELRMQYKIAKQRWKKIPFWVSLIVKSNYPYN